MRERNFFFLSSSKNITDGRERQKRKKFSSSSSSRRRRRITSSPFIQRFDEIYRTTTTHRSRRRPVDVADLFSRDERRRLFCEKQVKGPKNTRKREEGAVKNASSSTTISNNKESERHDKTYHRHILRLFRSLSMRSAFVYVFVSPFFFWRRRRSQKTSGQNYLCLIFL